MGIAISPAARPSKPVCTSSNVCNCRGAKPSARSTPISLARSISIERHDRREHPQHLGNLERAVEHLERQALDPRAGPHACPRHPLERCANCALDHTFLDPFAHVHAEPRNAVVAPVPSIPLEPDYDAVVPGVEIAKGAHDRQSFGAARRRQRDLISDPEAPREHQPLRREYAIARRDALDGGRWFALHDLHTPATRTRLVGSQRDLPKIRGQDDGARHAGPAHPVNLLDAPEQPV
jgi:hypothetical protein